MTSRTRLTLFGLLAFTFALCISLPAQEYTYAVAPDFRIPGLTDLQARQAIRGGMEMWTGEANLSFRQVPELGEKYIHADGGQAVRIPDFTFTNFLPGERDMHAGAHCDPRHRTIYVNLRPSYPYIYSGREYVSLLGHEVGHQIMNRYGHSRDSKDLMYGGHLNRVPSARERAWAVAKYGRKVR